MNTTLPLFKHQKQSIKKLRDASIIFDMSDPGTGKTRVQIEDFAARRRKGAPPALITATRSNLYSAWADDFKTFAPDLTISVALASNRNEAFTPGADVYITNHDAVKWLEKQPKKFWKPFEGGTIINDESTVFKHQSTARSKAIAKLMPYFEHKRNMSGTPNPNGICDLWHQVFLLDRGQRLGKSFFQFRAAACHPEKTGPGPNMVKWVDRPNIETIVSALIKDISIRHRFEDCVDIPPNFAYAKSIPLKSSHTKHYEEMQEFQLTRLENTKITAVNKAVMRIKLLQIASGAVYNDSGGYTKFDTDRYEYVLDLVEECAHSVVFFQWEHQKVELTAEATRRGITFAIYDGKTSDAEREVITQRFQAGDYQTIFAHPKSAAHGLTWTKGTRTIWASPTDNLEWYIQGGKRIYRIGQTEKTETITVLANGTYDELAWERLEGKASRANAFNDELRRLL